MDFQETERSLENSLVYVIYEYDDSMSFYGPPTLVCQTQEYADAWVAEKGEDKYTWEAFRIR